MNRLFPEYLVTKSSFGMTDQTLFVLGISAGHTGAVISGLRVPARYHMELQLPAETV